MKKIQSLLLLIIIIMPAMANANWAGSLVEVKGIGFLPNDKQKNIQVNFTLRMNPPSNYSEGHKIETLLLKKGNITIQCWWQLCMRSKPAMYGLITQFQFIATALNSVIVTAKIHSLQVVKF